MSGAVPSPKTEVVVEHATPPAASVAIEVGGRQNSGTNAARSVASAVPILNNTQQSGSSAGCNGCLLPTFQLPWSSTALNRTVSAASSVNLFNQELAIQRLQDATQRNNNARLVWFSLHAIFIGFVLIVDSDLSRAIKKGQYWYYGIYSLGVLLTVGQYLYTAGSSPGYVQELMAQLEEQDVEATAAGRPLRIPSTSYGSGASLQRTLSTPEAVARSPSSGAMSHGSSGSLGRPSFMMPPPVATVTYPAERTPLLLATSLPSTTNSSSGSLAESGGRLTAAAVQAAGMPAKPASSQLSFFPRVRSPSDVGRLTKADSLQLLRRTDSNRRCPYCNVWQPMRSKHCHDCDKCVLRFDHHCFWVGTCVGQRNHCRFWWYLLYETTLTLWTLWICITAFKWEPSPEAWMEHNIFILIATINLVGLFTFLASLVSFHTWLVLTNQTTYETTRRKRIPYLRYIPDDVYPFSNGFIANVSQFCCTPSSVYPLYTIPSVTELATRANSRSWLRNEYYRCY